MLCILKKIKELSQYRSAWLTLLVCTISFELCALFFEHFMGLKPCVMCIYERVAMAGIIIAAIVGLLAPKNTTLRVTGLAAWGYSAYQGLHLTIEHVGFQLHPSPFSTCDLFVNFPQWAPLNHWMPWMFEAYGECSKIVWHFLGLTMPQCLEIIFTVNLIACCIVGISQLTFSRTK